MTTSGSYSFTLNTQQLIQMAFAELNLFEIGVAPDSFNYNYALVKLNLILTDLESEGIRLWKRKEATLFPDLLTPNYEIGSVTGASHCANSYVSTTCASTGSGSTTIVVTSTTGMSVNDNIGIELDDGTRQWTTITNINTLTLTLNTATTNTAASGNTIITYTNLIACRPLEIIRMTTLDLKSNNTETQLDDIGYDQYMNQPIKSTPGRPNNFYYSRLLNNTLPYTGTLFLFPNPDSVSRLLKFTYNEPIQVMLNNNDTFDMPQEWLKTILINLSADLCRPYGKIAEKQSLDQEAIILKEKLKAWDADDSNLTFKLKYK